MDYYITFGLGILSGVFGTLLTQYFNRAKLSIKSRPYLYPSMFSYFGTIQSNISNKGLTAANVTVIKLQLKNGSSEDFISNQSGEVNLVIGAKSTVEHFFNVTYESEQTKNKIQKFKLLRIIVITTDQRVYKGNWLNIKECMEFWDSIQKVDQWGNKIN